MGSGYPLQSFSNKNAKKGLALLSFMQNVAVGFRCIEYFWYWLNGVKCQRKTG
jgi:hypothetical protein